MELSKIQTKKAVQLINLPEAKKVCSIRIRVLQMLILQKHILEYGL